MPRPSVESLTGEDPRWWISSLLGSVSFARILLCVYSSHFKPFFLTVHIQHTQQCHPADSSSYWERYQSSVVTNYDDDTEMSHRDGTVLNKEIRPCSARPSRTEHGQTLSFCPYTRRQQRTCSSSRYVCTSYMICSTWIAREGKTFNKKTKAFRVDAIA